MASAFASGFKMGGDMFDASERNRLLQEQLAMEKGRDARAAEEFGWRRDQRAREDEAFSNYANLSGGINRDTQSQISRTYGMNPQQIAAAVQSGGAEGLRTQLAGYDQPDNFELQNAPAVGVQPGRFSAAQLQFAQPSRMDRERGLEQLAVARRDVQGLRQSQDAQRVIQKDDIASQVMKMPRADLEKMAPDITTSGYPLLYTGKDKNGYTFLKTEADGKTPIPGSQFTLNESQLRQMAMAHELGKAGFGTEALATLSAAHKDVGDHVSKWNDTISKAATTSNTATHYGNQDQSARITANAAATNARSAADLRKAQTDAIKDAAANREEAAGLAAEYEALTPEEQVGPKGIGLIRRFNMLNVKAGGQVQLGGKGGNDKPVKIEEAGTRMMVGGRAVQADGYGGYIDMKGVLPDERTKALKTAGVPDNLIGELPWSADGKSVGYRGRAYDVTSKADMKALVDDYTKYSANDRKVDELIKSDSHAFPNRRNPLAFGPKLTYPNPDPAAPSLYAGPEAWAAYRQTQSQRESRRLGNPQQ